MSPRDLDHFDQIPQNLVRGHSLQFGARAQHDTVSECREQDALNIVGSNKVATTEPREALCAHQQHQPRSRASANREGVVLAGRLEQLTNIRNHFFTDVRLTDRLLRGKNLCGAEHWLPGPDEVATSLGMDGVISAGLKNEDEGLYPVQHGYWRDTMLAALEKEAGK